VSMPWKESSVMEERRRFGARLLDGEAMTDLCRDFGISRKTGYKIFDRSKEHGLEALTDRSRRPVRTANQLPQQIESLIVRLKGEKPHWGARKIRELLIRRLDGDVRVPANSKVTEVRPDGVQLADGGFIPSELVIWCAGVKGPDVLSRLDGLETNRIGQLVVAPTLRTTRDPDIFAIGDCAACPQPGGAGDVPPRAQAAHQEASHLVKQLPRRLRGEPLKPYVYHDFGSLVSLGRSTVGNLMGFLVGKNFFIEGYFARLMYRSLYKMHEAALHGLANMILGTIGRTFGRRNAPVVKLH
jgi:transposase